MRKLTHMLLAGTLILACSSCGVETTANYQVIPLPQEVALSHGIGSESQRPLAIVIIGGVLCDTFFTLFIFPLIVEVIYGKTLYDKEGKLRQRRV